MNLKVTLRDKEEQQPIGVSQKIPPIYEFVHNIITFENFHTLLSITKISQVLRLKTHLN